MLTIEALKNWGADTDEGLGRCYGNEALYLRLVKMVPAEKNFDKLEAAVGSGDGTAAFEAAHALKGVLGNLSLTPMTNICTPLTERLRAKTDTDCAPMVAELLALKESLAALCSE